MTPGIGPKGAVHLLEQFGDARSVFAATAGELTGKAELRPELVQQIVRRKGFSAAERNSPTAAATALRPSPRPTRNTRRCCAKSPTIPT
ncbi:MAG: hypothetical protein V8Q54_08865 [Alistipes senegalensis]